MTRVHEWEENAVLLEACTIKFETEKAWLVMYEDEEVWLPKSQVLEEESSIEWEKGSTGTIAVTEWIAGEKGLL